MHFNTHYNLQGSHAFLSASKYAWVNYDDEKLERTFAMAQAAKKGDELHSFAAEAIRLGVKLQKSPTTLSMYVNDAIGFRMTPEQTLFVSDNAYGTCDAISFRKERPRDQRLKLRIHDLKTGQTPVSRTQLDVYATFFCMEYRINPFDIDIELRIYQNDAFDIFEGDPDLIRHIEDTTRRFDKLIMESKRAELLG